MTTTLRRGERHYSFEIYDPGKLTEMVTFRGWRLVQTVALPNGDVLLVKERRPSRRRRDA